VFDNCQDQEDLSMSEIKLPIVVGQKFLSGNDEFVVRFIDGKQNGRPVCAENSTGTLRIFTLEGEFNQGHGMFDLQPIPVVAITEGVEFCGPEYADGFKELVEAGREFEIKTSDDQWVNRGSRKYETICTYRLVPQHLDANGNALKVGDRVTDYRGRKFEIWEIVNLLAVDVNGSSEYLTNCRLLTTIKRPLCAADLMANRTALFKIAESEYAYAIEGFDSFRVSAGGQRFTYLSLQEKWEWSPSADQPWQPCEVEEEVLV
jgi:hypothetical protein